MSALVKAAKKEGSINVITIPLAGWANYGLIMKDFTKKYGIKINDENPNGSSAEEITAIQQDKGRASAPDVVDVGTSYATQNMGLWAPYKVQTWSLIPSASKDPNGRWFDDYGGYVAIGCDTKIVTTCPTSFAALKNPIYKNQVAINNDPTSASAAFYAVYAAALANGGSFSNIQPGIDFFANLNKIGNFVPGGSAQTRRRARPRSCCGGTTSKTVSRRRFPAGSRSSRLTARSRRTTPRRSPTTHHTPRPRDCGRSSCTPPWARTCSSRDTPARSNCPG